MINCKFAEADALFPEAAGCCKIMEGNVLNTAVPVAACGSTLDGTVCSTEDTDADGTVCSTEGALEPTIFLYLIKGD